jgi:TRAP-type C4-dicarboxylate transport system substrate-binding protein
MAVPRLHIAVSAAVLLAAAGAHASPVVLRIATAVPQGTAWARELSAFARDIKDGTDDAVELKVYFGGIAGSELEVLDRIKRDQLDGELGSEACTILAPTMRVSRIVGLFQSREENAFALTRLKPEIEKEFLKNGFVYFGAAGLGPEVLFTRTPVTTFSELRRVRFWVWDLDRMLRTEAANIGLTLVPLPLDEAARAYDEKRVDGLIAVPSAALAFQWSAQARYLTDLRISFRSGCLFMTTRAWDPLPLATHETIIAAAAKMRARLEDLGRRQDEELLGGLLARQGLKAMPLSATLRSEFFSASQLARDKLPADLVPKGLLQRVLGWLADFRAENGSGMRH